jgi:hypothetical protein
MGPVRKTLLALSVLAFVLPQSGAHASYVTDDDPVGASVTYTQDVTDAQVQYGLYLATGGTPACEIQIGMGVTPQAAGVPAESIAVGVAECAPTTGGLTATVALQYYRTSGILAGTWANYATASCNFNAGAGTQAVVIPCDVAYNHSLNDPILNNPVRARYCISGIRCFYSVLLLSLDGDHAIPPQDPHS